MNQRITRQSITIAMIMGVNLLIFSCFGKTSPATFYTLSALQEGDVRDKISQKISIAIGPVTIPPEMDRPQIITRDHENRVTLSEFHRWAGPLQEGITSVLSANLSTLLGTDRIISRRHENIFPFTHHLVLNINRFDGQLQGDVLLDVTWIIQKSSNPEPLIVKKSVIHEPVLSNDYNGLVAAQSKALSELSRQIAASLRTIRE
jgi:uncharacterized protein